MELLYAREAEMYAETLIKINFFRLLYYGIQNKKVVLYYYLQIVKCRWAFEGEHAAIRQNSLQIREKEVGDT